MKKNVYYNTEENDDQLEKLRDDVIEAGYQVKAANYALQKAKDNLLEAENQEFFLDFRKALGKSSIKPKEVASYMRIIRRELFDQAFDIMRGGKKLEANMKSFDFIEAGYKVGDRVWDSWTGEWKMIIWMEAGKTYSIGIDGYCFFTSNGRPTPDYFRPRFFPNEFEIPDEAFQCPRPNLKPGDPIVVWNHSAPQYRRHFHSWTLDGQPRTFTHGKSAWSGHDNISRVWDNWRLPTPEELNERDAQ